MSQLEFQLRGIAMNAARSRTSLKPSRVSALAPIVIAGLVVLAAYGGKLHNGSRPSTWIGGKEVTAKRALVLVDNSGSMDTSRDRLVSTIARLRAAGIDVSSQVPVFGFAITEDTRYSLLNTLKDRLAADPSIDTVYFISDFDLGDERENTPQGVVSFAIAIGKAHVRLYCASVNRQPSSLYYNLARRSGGDVIWPE